MINTDGFVIDNQQWGGIPRDSPGKLLAVFAANLDRCSIMRAEVRVAEFGLCIAWDMGFRKVHLQLDSSAGVAAILGESESDSRHGRTLQIIEELRNRNWEIKISHICREGNRIADLLAHHGHYSDFGFHTNGLYVPS
ncbi:Putative ribonuclease H protein At1g65750 [Linum perenne]